MDANSPTERLEPFVTVRQASRAFNIGRHLIHREGELGELKVFNPGSWARVRLSDVEAWLERRGAGLVRDDDDARTSRERRAGFSPRFPGALAVTSSPSATRCSRAVRAVRMEGER